MAVALVLIGVFALSAYKAQEVSDWLRQRVGEMEVFLVEGVNDSEAESVHERVQTLPGIASAEYVSEDEARAVFREEFGEGAEIFFEEPFLPASVRVRVTPAYANPDSLEQFATQFQRWEAVDEAVFNQDLLVKVQRNLQLITTGGLALGVLVVLASVFLVANTIRLTIYARRLLIRTMKLVGATNAFVRRPFIIEGMLQGLIAGAIAGGVLWGGYELAVQQLPQLGPPTPWTGLALPAVLAVGGMVLGWLGSFLAVRRFIKNVALH
jgi:cell division transport system permease protein